MINLKKFLFCEYDNLILCKFFHAIFAIDQTLEILNKHEQYMRTDLQHFLLFSE